MRRGLAAVGGLLLGVIAGLALMLVNPLVHVGALDGTAAGGAGIATRYTMPEVTGLQVGPAPLLGLGAAAAADPTLQAIRIGIAVLPAAAAAPAALAVKVSVRSPRNSLWQARLGLLDYWSIAWPGEGSAFATGYGNYWELGRDLSIALVSGQGRAGLKPAYAISALPPVDDAAGLFGSSGRYAGLRGSIRETLEPRPDGPPVWTLTLLPDEPATWLHQQGVEGARSADPGAVR